MSSLKNIALFALILLSSIACEKDFEDVGVGLVDNNLFSTKDTIFEIIAYNSNTTISRVDGIPQYLLGVYKDDNFGKLNAAFVSQLGLPSKIAFGDNVSIDTIILDIPYYVTRLNNNSNGTPNFKLDSIQGNVDLEYTLSVHELGTFLNALDPQDPTKRKKYYSNGVYTKKALLYSGQFKPNENDTVLYIKRSFFDDEKSIDTIKKNDLIPSIKIPLDSTFFRTNFINKESSEAFTSQNNFIDFFRGIYIDANGVDGSLMTLAMSDATVTIYYTNTVLKDETEVDLNGDGDLDDKDVPVRTKQQKVFTINGIRANQYIRDYSGTPIEDQLSNTDPINGDTKLFLQGAAGSESILKLFNGIDLSELRNKNWLINEANITLYIDETSGSNVPAKLLLYNYNNKSQLLDVYSEARVNGIGGGLERNSDEGNKAIKYKFRITDYITEVLKSESPRKLDKMAIKVFHPTDAPNFIALNDTIIKDFSWISKGVVLKGNKLESSDKERLKLEIFYTEQN